MKFILNLMKSSTSFRAIIFSKDRAMQLDALLRSYYRYCIDAEMAELTVLYFASNEKYERQYKTLQQENPHAHFVAQSDFRQDVIHILGGYPAGGRVEKILRWVFAPQPRKAKGALMRKRLRHWVAQKFLQPLVWGVNEFFSSNRVILFMVDDNLFTRRFSVSQAARFLNTNPDAVGFSLRLGGNTTFSYMKNSSQSLPFLDHVSEGIFMCNWTIAEHDFGYPLEISSSIYRAPLIYFLLSQNDFSNPNVLESRFASSAGNLKEKYPLLLCYKTSVAFCNPVNMVQTEYRENRARQVYYHAVDELADRFDAGEHIDLSFFDDFVPNSCHQEVELTFKRKK